MEWGRQIDKDKNNLSSWTQVEVRGTQRGGDYLRCVERW